MKPTEFPGSNVVLGADQPEYLPLPALTVGDPEGTVISCWELDDADVEILTATRRLWLSQLTFGQPLQPQCPSTTAPELPDAQPTQQVVTETDEIDDLYRMDCRVEGRYDGPMDLIVNLLTPALRMMLQLAAKQHEKFPSNAPPPGSVITLMMSIDRTHAADHGGIVLPGGRA